MSWTDQQASVSWTGPAEASVSWQGPAEASVSWQGPAEASVSWRNQRGIGELDGTSGGIGELDGTSGGIGELDGTSGASGWTGQPEAESWSCSWRDEQRRHLPRCGRRHSPRRRREQADDSRPSSRGTKISRRLILGYLGGLFCHDSVQRLHGRARKHGRGDEELILNIY